MSHLNMIMYIASSWPCVFLFFFAEYIWVFILTLELSKWLEPLEKVRFEIGSISTLVDYIKQVQISQS